MSFPTASSVRFALIAATFALPLSVAGAAFAAGSDSSEPPKPSDGTKQCWGKRVYDPAVGKCVKPEKSSMNGDQLLQTARELAYLDRFEDAQAVLAAHPDQQDSGVLTYWGFTNRKLGQMDQAQAYYDQAIAQDPNNLLARSYMGQGYVTEGKMGLALAQWKEIRARGGEGTWAETSLRAALETGATANY